MSNKTDIWTAVQNTDSVHIKDVNLGARKFKAIDAYSQIMTATVLWGPYGSAWGVKEEKFTPILTNGNDVAIIIYTAILYYPEGEFPINSDIRINEYVKSKDYWKSNVDFAKKVSTDAMTKGLSKLGFNADVFLGAFDGNKYEGIENLEIDFKASEESMLKLKSFVPKLKEAGRPEKAQFIENKLIDGLKEDQAQSLIKKCEVMLNA